MDLVKNGEVLWSRQLDEGNPTESRGFGPGCQRDVVRMGCAQTETPGAT